MVLVVSECFLCLCLYWKSLILHESRWFFSLDISTCVIEISLWNVVTVHYMEIHCSMGIKSFLLFRSQFSLLLSKFNTSWFKLLQSIRSWICSILQGDLSFREGNKFLRFLKLVLCLQMSRRDRSINASAKDLSKLLSDALKERNLPLFSILFDNHQITVNVTGRGFFLCSWGLRPHPTVH